MLTNEELAVSIAKVEERLDGLVDDVREIRDAIVGNGSRPGIVERVTVAEQRVIGTESRLTALEGAGREQSKLSWRALASVIGLATTLAAIIGELVKHLV